MAAQGTLESIAITLARLFKPLEEEFQAGRIRVLFAELGLEFPASLDTKTAFINALKSTVVELEKLPVELKELISAIQAEDFSKILESGSKLFSSISKIVQGFSTIANELKSLSASFPGISSADINTFAGNLPKKLVEYLIIKNLEGTPGITEVLEFIGVVEKKDIVSGSLNYTQRALKIDEFFNFISKPGVQLEKLYDWGKPGFDGLKLLQISEKLLGKLQIPAVLDQVASPPVLDLTFLELKPRTDLSPKGLELKLLDKVVVDSQEFSRDDWKLIFGFGAQLGTGFRFVVQPNGKFMFIPPSGDVKGEASLEWIAGKSNGSPFVVLGQPGGSRVEAKQFSVKGGLGLKWDGATHQATGDFKIGGEVKGGKVVIDFSQGDGFLNQLLSAINLESDFDLGFGYSSKEGLYFYGSSALIIQLATHLNLGPIEISGLSFSIGLKDQKVPVAVALDFKAELGPLKITVEQMGVNANLSFPADQKGNLGPVNLDFGFKPPAGLGLTINAGAVIGGGYLFFDFDKEEYAGALELTIAGFISAKAIGIITTKMPDGSKGFSLLIIITAEFNPPFQLGYGFTLIGVGGLLGLNRTVLLEPLRDGVRTGAVNNIMFPQNVVANAPRIISDLKAIFPPYEGKFLIGPMAKIGWGTPTLISLSFGLIIEIPGNIAILGVIRIVLPDEAAPLVKIQVAFVGTIDFDKKLLTFDASLYESSILTMTLEGDMALRVKWGDQPDFLITVGGFHPSYTPPPLALPALKRLAINILNNDLGRIRVECYQAVTSNTVQFGAKAEVYFNLRVVEIEGYIAFDALFQFSPFYFIISLSAGFSLKVAGFDLLSVRVRMELSGPTPWRAKGTGSVSILFFEISADFDVTWGENKDTSLPPIKILQKFLDEFNKLEQWSTVLESQKNLLVSLKKIDESVTPKPLILHPSGSLIIQQKLVPLEVKIDKVGNQKVEDVQRFEITSASSNGTSLIVEDVTEDFARAQYQNLSDAEKLSKPSFEKMPGGVKLSMGGKDVKNGKMVRRVVQYEVTIIDKEPKKPFKFGKFLNQIPLLFANFLKGNSVSKSVLSKSYKQKLVPFDEKLSVKEEGYTVAFQENNKPYSISATFASEYMAQDFMDREILANPKLKKEIHIVPNYELQEI